MNKELKVILRWICVIPGGLLFAFLANFPLHWILYFTLVYGEGFIKIPLEDMKSIELFLYPILNSFIFVFSGSRIAPSRQFIVSIKIPQNNQTPPALNLIPIQQERHALLGL